MFGQNSLLTSRTRRWREVNEQNRQGWSGRVSDVLLKANVEQSESRYTKPAEDWPKRGVFSSNYQSSPVVILVQLLTSSHFEHIVSINLKFFLELSTFWAIRYRPRKKKLRC